MGVGRGDRDKEKQGKGLRERNTQDTHRLTSMFIL